MGALLIRAQLGLLCAAPAHAQTCELPPPAPAGDWPAVAREAAELLARYIRIDTSNPPGNELEAATFLACILAREGVAHELWRTGPGKGNLLARWPGTGAARPIVLLNHMDVVAARAADWRVPPFAGEQRGGYVWGRGALDMKGAGIAQLLALLQLVRTGTRLDRDVLFLATADEEIGGALGVRDVVTNRFDALRDPEFVLTEGGEVAVDERGRVLYFGIGTTEKSPLWIEAVARGPAGHGSLPHAAAATHRLIAALERIRTARQPVRLTPVVRSYFRNVARLTDPRVGRYFLDMDASVGDSSALAAIAAVPFYDALLRNTISITVLQGSESTNVFPSIARAELDVRLLPGEDPDRFLAELRALVADADVELRPLQPNRPATASGTDTRLFEALATAARRRDPGIVVTPSMLTGFTDCSYFRARGVTCYGVDPFAVPEHDGRGIHGVDERISTANLERGTRFLYDVLLTLAR